MENQSFNKLGCFIYYNNKLENCLMIMKTGNEFNKKTYNDNFSLNLDLGV